MGVFDFPVSELKTYRGTNPRPDDFDEYWERALKELDAQESDISLTPAAFRHPAAECFDLSFNGVGGARIYAKYLRPRNVCGTVPAVLCFHGYAGSSGDWSEHIAMAAAGFAVAAMDVRGQGGLSQDVGGAAGNTLHGHIVRGLNDPDPDRLLYRDIFLDTAMLARVVASFPEVDGERLAATGGSQGGGLTLACASLSNIKLAAPTYPFLSDYKRVWEMDLAQDAYAELKEHFRSFDPTHAREEEIFRKLGYIDIQFLAPRIRAKVRMYTGLMDTICPPSSQFATYNKIVSPKEVVFYPDFGHENLPGRADDVLEWLIREL